MIGFSGFSGSGLGFKDMDCSPSDIGIGIRSQDKGKKES
jgi:hypothetical protein